ncbi:acyltransferase family protein [Rufibacter roseolus]|uniref:acyltransferase family protein n=1 Tax=Rufibacter roseolus TaxID=2817375 RepID=UPI001B30EDA7|nr:acyltransferase [Rufibacter roseolus]
MGYIKQLDSLRAIAIFFVLCNHCLPADTLLHQLSLIIFAPDIFFTISGFLITMILLKDRRRAEVSSTHKGKVFSDFFLKRALRIFPAYYLTLLLTYVLEPNSVPRYSSYLNFTANFDMYSNKYWGELGHLWSMSVEQQFYLFWPLIILFIPKKFLSHTIVSFILAGIISQKLTPDLEFLWILPQTCFDALGIGAFLAWVVVEKNQIFPTVYKALRVLGPFSILVIAGQNLWGDFPSPHHRTLVALVVSWAIAYFLSVGDTGNEKLTWIFQNRALLLMGKISYGIYLYHVTVFNHSARLLHSFNKALPLPQEIKGNFYFFLSENLVLLFLLAWLSWKFFELPISNLKRHLKKEAPKSVAQQTA